MGAVTCKGNRNVFFFHSVIVNNIAQKIISVFENHIKSICCVLLIGCVTQEIASVNQKHYPNLGSDMSSVVNFCAPSSNIILQGNWWWHGEKLALFSGYSSLTLNSPEINHPTHECLVHEDQD